MLILGQCTSSKILNMNRARTWDDYRASSQGRPLYLRISSIAHVISPFAIPDLLVPRVYPALPNRGILAVFALCGINNLRGFNPAFSAIPTAPTNSWLDA